MDISNHFRLRGLSSGLHTDYTGPLPVTAGRNQCVVLGICPLTKYGLAKAVGAATTGNAATCLVENVILKHGMIREILMDRGSHFRGEIMQRLLQVLGAKHLLTFAYHPQCDGQAERVIKAFSRILSHYLDFN